MFQNNQNEPKINLIDTTEGQASSRGQVNASALPQEKFEFNPVPGNSSSPQFGNNGGWKGKSGNWIKKNFSKIILPIIVILILVGGFAFFGKEKANENSDSEKMNLSNIIDEIKTSLDNGQITENQAKQDAKNETIKIEGKNIVVSAEKGNGVTHLARKALNKYLAEKGGEGELTKEHKIYIEDYLKDYAGSRPLEIGDEISFSEDLIAQAIDSSLDLTGNDLTHLENYSKLVPSL